MQRAFGVAGGPRGIDQHRRIVRPRIGGVERVGPPVQRAVVILQHQPRKPLRRALGQTLAQHQPQIGQVAHDLRQYVQAGRIGDQRRRAGIAQTMAQRLGAEQRGQGQRHAAHAPGGDMGGRGLHRLLQHDADAGSGRTCLQPAHGHQRMRQPRRLAAQIAIAVLKGPTVLVDLQNGCARGVAVAPVVADRDAHVQPRGHLPAKAGQTLRRHRTPLQGRLTPQNLCLL